MVVSGEEMSRYMGIDQWEADHVTLVLEGGVTHQEVQLLYFHRPQVVVDPTAGSLDRTGFNHVCFRVGDLDDVLARLAGTGFTPRNEIMEFHDRRLVFLDGPGIVVELAQWVTAPSGVDVLGLLAFGRHGDQLGFAGGGLLVDPMGPPEVKDPEGGQGGDDAGGQDVCRQKHAEGHG